MSKDKLVQIIQDLPEKFSFEEVLDRIVLLQKVETGLEQSGSGDTKSTRDAKDHLKKWLCQI